MYLSFSLDALLHSKHINSVVLHIFVILCLGILLLDLEDISISRIYIQLNMQVTIDDWHQTFKYNLCRTLGENDYEKIAAKLEGIH